MTHKGTITLETERLILRIITDNDIPSYSPSEGQKAHLTEMMKEYDKMDFYYWIIVKKASKEAVGLMRTINNNDEMLSCEMAYETRENFRNKGYATEALKRILEFLFIEVGYNRIFAGHLADNPASGRVMEKAGMRFEGIFRQDNRNSEKVLTDSKKYAILAEDYFKHKTIVTPENTTCRFANESDYDAIIEMSRVWSSEQITRGLMTNSRESLAGLSLWVAEYGGKIVGYCSGVKKYAENYSVFPSNVDYFEVDELYVLPDYRGKNIGKILLSFIESELKKQGVSHFLLSSATSAQERIAKFYKSCGYGVWITTFYK
jgi:ribosomal-protein-alanine N-acetyltransferase